MLKSKSKTKLLRQAQHLAMKEMILKDLLDSLGATTSYDEPTSMPTPRPPAWSDFYGWDLALEADEGAILTSDGGPSKLRLVKRFTANPGDIINSRGGQSYMVRQDHSLRKI
jgi:hypothetical protein